MHSDMGDTGQQKRRRLDCSPQFSIPYGLAKPHFFAGVSLLTQVLYATVFCTRYLDLFWTNPAKDEWNFVLKIFYILSSFYIIFLMTRVYARTREREKAWKLGAICLGGAIVAAPFVTLINVKWERTTFPEVG